MSKQLKFTYQDKEYTLEYTRRSVEQMEKSGFIASDIQDKPMTVLPALFRGAFLANHRFVKTDIIDTHEGSEKVKFNGYNEKTSLTTELLIPAPYDEVYIRYLEMQIDYANGEYGKYNNSTTMYNTAYSAFDRYYNRTHMPIGKKFKIF